MASRKLSFGISMPTDEGAEGADQVTASHDRVGGEVATGNRLPNNDNAHRDLATPERPWDPVADPFFSATSYPPTVSHYFTDGAQDTDADHVMQDTMATPNQPPAHFPLGQLDYGEPFLTLTEAEKGAMATILEPVRDKLVALKRTTEESLPPYHPSTRANPHAQVLGTRLDGIAKHAQQHLARVAESGRGMEELRLCRYVADKYWPLPVTATTHLDIFRIYRNRLARQVPPAQIEAEQAQHESWVQDVASRRRETFGEAAARLAGRLQSELNDSIVVSMLEEEERQKQVENDGQVARMLAEQLDAERSYASNRDRHIEKVDEPACSPDYSMEDDCRGALWSLDADDEEAEVLPIDGPLLSQAEDNRTGHGADHAEALRKLHREVEDKFAVDHKYHESFTWPLDDDRARQLAQDAKIARMLQTKLDAESQNIPALLPLDDTNHISRPRLDDWILTRDFAQQEALDGPQCKPHTRYRTAREKSTQGNPCGADPQAAIQPRAPAAHSRSTHERRTSAIEEETEDEDDGV
ncbi:hypothetical protein HBI56_071840 [Parastagonospora nodorum]|uniref:Uncharacterized protein n=1 Tax=Phaeosphaeria nodorum (strain SN15 / ATCC MYA-4574 / FGSC 10173) TaxID=321614 RepID=A0A7U2EST7_PHANO|nr:hypothetical protein HBH56_006290 [Parastagonospora nodorum]QRC90484.1 hypothetical protein JI435_098990 [Parastagonospora nodorum SN15]KAH3937667.1 hypothetical protein HBH54_006280 [Parastagonospora nodorum]KAH3946631.1 hypothetical protein HBH53_125690 [Parastagonospora nodorum]KAH3975033.1 hypothetical protein HBH51_089000 [Parastagonospora nodorum]